MTEAEWIDGTELKPMLTLIRRKIRRRKARLFALACCRHIWDLLPAKKYRTMVEVSERYFEKQAKMDEVSNARGGMPLGPERAAYAAWALTGAVVATRDPFWWVFAVAQGAVNAQRGEEGGIVSVLREVVGNPFTPSSVDPVWSTAPVISVAQAAYEQRSMPSGHLDPGRLAVLSDALEEAGCADAAVLDHLRSPGPHVRGCWALDLILGKR